MNRFQRIGHRCSGGKDSGREFSVQVLVETDYHRTEADVITPWRLFQMGVRTHGTYLGCIWWSVFTHSMAKSTAVATLRTHGMFVESGGRAERPQSPVSAAHTYLSCHPFQLDGEEESDDNSGNVDNKAGAAVHLSPLHGFVGPELVGAAVVSAVPNAVPDDVPDDVPDAVEAIIDQATPTDEPGFGGGDGNVCLVHGLAASVSPTNQVSDGEPAGGAVAAAALHAGEESPVIEAEVSSGGVEDGRVVSSPPPVEDCHAIASSGSREEGVSLDSRVRVPRRP